MKLCFIYCFNLLLLALLFTNQSMLAGVTCMEAGTIFFVSSVLDFFPGAEKVMGVFFFFYISADYNNREMRGGDEKKVKTEEKYKLKKLVEGWRLFDEMNNKIISDLNLNRHCLLPSAPSPPISFFHIILLFMWKDPLIS